MMDVDKIAECVANILFMQAYAQWLEDHPYEPEGSSEPEEGRRVATGIRTDEATSTVDDVWRWSFGDARDEGPGVGTPEH